jgi:hypothetical protein
MKFIAAFMIAAVLGLTGCAGLIPPRPLHWSRENTTQDQFMTDRYECMKESGSYCDLFTACLGARGYARDYSGPLAPPSGSSFICLQRGGGGSSGAAWANGARVLGDGISQGVGRVGQPQAQPSFQQTTTNCYTDRYGFTNCTTH